MGSFHLFVGLFRLTIWVDGLLLALHDVVFQLEGVPCATGRATHKYLATALGLDQFVYAVLLFCG
jgi:hypothetical protein